MNNTSKSKSLPKNTTRKRCPKGERWNKTQNKCLPHVKKTNPTTEAKPLKTSELNIFKLMIESLFPKSLITFGAKPKSDKPKKSKYIDSIYTRLP